MPLKDYYRPFERVLIGDDERDEYPKKVDLYPDRIYLDKNNIKDVQTLLFDHRYCLVEGEERRGKTTLVRYVGVQYLEDHKVFQMDVSRVRDGDDLNEFINQLFGGTLDRPDVLIIIEDCHIKPEITEKLLRRTEECTKASFLFTMRTVKQNKRILVEDPFEDSVIRENDWVVRLDANEETIYNNIKGIVDKFVKNNESDLMRKSKPVPTHEDYQFLLEQTGGNKRILNYYLKAWRDVKTLGMLLQKTDRELVLKQFRKERLSGLSPNQLKVLKSMSVLGQFEMPIFIEPLFPSDVFSVTKELGSLRGLVFNLPPDKWLLADTESIFTLECLRASDVFIYNILKTYVTEAPNYFEVFRALQRAQKRELLISLIADIEVFKSLVSQLRNDKTSLSEIMCVLRAVGWTDKAKALDLWRKYREAFGEKFIDNIRHKLSESPEIRLISLLNFLRTIDKEGEAVPLAISLPAEFFIKVSAEYPSACWRDESGLVRKLGWGCSPSRNAPQLAVGYFTSKSRLESMGFVTFNNNMNKLISLSPEIVKHVLKYLNESDYRRLGEKAREHHLQQIMWFLKLLAIDTELKAPTNAFLKGLGLEFLLKMIRTSPFGVVGRVIDFLYVMAPETAVLALKNLDKSDYNRLGELAGGSSTLQRINWFLRGLGKNEELRSFGMTFLEALDKGKILDLIASSNLGMFSNFESCANRVGREWVDKLIQRTDFPWDKLLINSSVGNIAQAFSIWSQIHSPDLREQRKTIVRRCSDADIPWENGQQKQLIKHMGRLLNYSYYLDEDGAKMLTAKAIDAFDPETMEYTLEHLVLLLKNSRWCNPDAAHQLVEKIFVNSPTSLSSRGHLNWLCQLIWQSILSNESRTKQWITEINEAFWEDLAVNAPASDAFHLLLVLWQVNEVTGRKVAHAVAQQLLISPKPMENLQTIPLLGFFIFSGLKPQGAIPFPPTENIDKLCIYPTSMRLACSLFYLQESKPEAIPDFIKAILTLRGMIPVITLLLTEHPLPWTASSLVDILVSVKNESRTESEDVYDRAILLLHSIQGRVIFLNTILNEMCAPQFTRPLDSVLEAESDLKTDRQKKRSWATIRLNKAIDKRIFTVRHIDNPIAHIASRSLSLNWDNPQVTFTIDVTRDLLFALHNARRDKTWANCDTWDSAFSSRWIGEPLAQRQLRYWQGILLKMNIVKVDYKETDKGKWGIMFQVNYEHPLSINLLTKSDR